MDRFSAISQAAAARLLIQAETTWKSIEWDQMGVEAQAAYVVLVRARVIEERITFKAWWDEPNPPEATVEVFATGDYRPEAIALAVQHHVPGWSGHDVAIQAMQRGYRLTADGVGIRETVVDYHTLGRSTPEASEFIDNRLATPGPERISVQMKSLSGSQVRTQGNKKTERVKAREEAVLRGASVDDLCNKFGISKENARQTISRVKKARRATES